MGLAYGLASAVLSFNRLPTLLTAVIRRIHTTLAAAYFDDMPVVDTMAGWFTGTASLRAVATAAGSPPHPDKGFPPGQYRHFLGANLRLAGAAERSKVTAEPKTAMRQAITKAIDTALETNQLSPGAASKLMGVCLAGWHPTHAAELVELVPTR